MKVDKELIEIWDEIGEILIEIKGVSASPNISDKCDRLKELVARILYK